MKSFTFLMVSFVILAGFLTAAEPVPIVEVHTDYLIGSYSAGKWLKSEIAAKSVKAGTKFRVYGLTRELGESKGGKPVPNMDVCEDVFTIELSPKPEQGAIAIAAPWNAMPRAPKIIDATQPVYVQAVAEFLQGKGIKDPKVKITKIVRVDIEGDGEEEVLISATNYFQKEGNVPNASPAGSYSFVILRRVVGGKLRTQLVDGEFYPKAKTFNAPGRYEICAVLDLDGDGKLEVVLSNQYYEGGWTTIYRCTPDKVSELLTVACGV
jgi:hypothetical protein